MPPLVLHSYWRSSAACRVRIGVNLKGRDHRQMAHALRAGEQSNPRYLAMAPQGLVPALEATAARCAEPEVFAHAAPQRETVAT